MSDIRDWAAFIRGRWNWTRFGYEKNFPRGCQFSDVDAVTEFNGRTLYIESKHWDGISSREPLPEGQRRLLKHMAEQPDVTVISVWGCACCDDPLFVQNMATGEKHDWRAHSKPERRAAFKALIDEAMGVGA